MPVLPYLSVVYRCCTQQPTPRRMDARSSHVPQFFSTAAHHLRRWPQPLQQPVQGGVRVALAAAQRDRGLRDAEAHVGNVRHARRRDRVRTRYGRLLCCAQNLFQRIRTNQMRMLEVFAFPITERRLM